MTSRRHGLRTRRSPILFIAMFIMLCYTLVPLVWLVLNATKTQGDLYTTFGLGPGHTFALFQNLADTFTHNHGEFTRWLLNTLGYSIVGAGGASILATLAGYALAQFRLPGKRAVIAVILGALSIPATALAVPTFLMFSKLGLTNSPLAVIIPSLVSPFGVFLIWTFVRESVPTELVEAARLDGAGELRIFWNVALPMMAPGFITVVLFAFVATWNNYFLPLIMLSNSRWFPLTVGLNLWSQQAVLAGGQAIYNLVITGALIAVIPVIIVFLLMQRYWIAGVTEGSVKG